MKEQCRIEWEEKQREKNAMKTKNKAEKCLAEVKSNAGVYLYNKLL